jgi:hypothetical protein
MMDMRARSMLALLLAAGVSLAAGGCTAKSPAQSEPESVAEAKADAAATQGAEEQAQPQLARGKLEIGSPGATPVRLTVEIAAKDSERQKGLMFRTQLGDDEGMIFLFSTERYNSFWMHNTLIPLDMFFIDSDWNVVGVVENAAPQTDDPRRVDKMSRYVLEVKAGFAARHGLGAGAQVKFMPPAALELP